MENNMENLKWVTNIYDPRKSNAKLYFKPLPFQDKDSAWNQHIEWVKQFIIGPPKGTDLVSAEDLAKEGAIGLYIEPDPPSNQSKR